MNKIVGTRIATYLLKTIGVDIQKTDIHPIITSGSGDR